MLKILIVDDKPHARDQVSHALDQLHCDTYEITWFDNVAALQKADRFLFDLAFVDFFLSNDDLYGSDVLDLVSAKILIGFSSNRFGSVAIKERAEVVGFGNTAAIQKIKETLENPELQTFLRVLLRS